MSGLIPSHDVVVVRESDAEIPGGAPVTGRLYADSSATGGALRLLGLDAVGSRASPPDHPGWVRCPGPPDMTISAMGKPWAPASLHHSP